MVGDSAKAMGNMQYVRFKAMVFGEFADLYFAEY
jgi:hypothetical protein